ncbi:hypothetical protein AHAS_Ahas11G0046200 [Arachis hypogaea]
MIEFYENSKHIQRQIQWKSMEIVLSRIQWKSMEIVLSSPAKILQRQIQWKSMEIVLPSPAKILHGDIKTSRVLNKRIRWIVAQAARQKT